MIYCTAVLHVIYIRIITSAKTVTIKQQPMYYAQFIPVMLLSSAQNVTQYDYYYAHNYCNYAIVHIQFYYFQWLH